MVKTKKKSKGKSTESGQTGSQRPEGNWNEEPKQNSDIEKKGQSWHEEIMQEEAKPSKNDEPRISCDDARRENVSGRSHSPKKGNYREFGYRANRDDERRSFHSRKSEPVRSTQNHDDKKNTRHSLNERGRDQRTPRDNSKSRKSYKSRQHQDPEFLEYEDEFRSQRGKIDYEKTKEIVSDLFEVPEEYALAHCVAEDMSMGSGIAVEFRYKFKNVDNLLNQQQKSGGLAILTVKDRFIYYLVTKKYSSGKPTYPSLFASLKCLRSHMKENKIRKIAMPRIGCGLDRLDWENVKFMIEFLFRNMDVDILVCNLEPTEDSSPQRHKNSKVIHEKYPIQDIAECTIIIYFSTEDGHISEEMEKLDDKFHFLTEFKNSRRIIGNVILYTKNQNYLLCGCIVRKSPWDKFDFVAFQKCLPVIQKENRKSNFIYYAFQAFKDEDDDCINYKIINILRNSLRGVEVYVCWPGDLQNEMIPKDRLSFEGEGLKFDSKRENENRGDWRTGNDRRSDWNSKSRTDAQARSTWRFRENQTNSPLPPKQETIESKQGAHMRVPASDADTYSEGLASNQDNTEVNDQWFQAQNEQIDDQGQEIASRQNEWDDYYKRQNEQSNHQMSWDSQALGDVAEGSQSLNLWQQDSPLQDDTKQKPLETMQSNSITNEYQLFSNDLESGRIDCSNAKDETNPSLPKQYSLVCYAQEDFNIDSGVPPGQGIAGPQIGKLLAQKQTEGGMAFVKDGNACIYCLIVSKPNKSPTSNTMFSSIQKLRDHIKKQHTKKLIVPVMDDCGELTWSRVKNMFLYLLRSYQTEMIFASFQPLYNVPSLLKQNNNKIIHTRSGIHQMKKKSVIIYLASVDNYLSKEIFGLDKRFEIIGNFKKEKKNLGVVLPHRINEDYVLYGCVVRNKHTDSIDFEELCNCLLYINEQNKKCEKLQNVGIQALSDADASYKIITLLLHCLKDLTICMCWPGELRSLMPTKSQ